MSRESQPITALDVGHTITLPDTHHREGHAGREVELIDYTRVGEYGPGAVYAYADPETGEYLGLLNVSLLPEGTTVNTR